MEKVAAAADFAGMKLDWAPRLRKVRVLDGVELPCQRSPLTLMNCDTGKNEMAGTSRIGSSIARLIYVEDMHEKRKGG
jgi:hypothetical protein